MTSLPDVIALGETMRSVITLPSPAETSGPFVTHGGAESNACVALARLGFSAAWVSGGYLAARAPGPARRGRARAGGRCGVEVASAIGDTGSFRAPVRSGRRSS